MTTLSVDLASKSYGDLGVVVLVPFEEGISASPVRLAAVGLAGKPNVLDLAVFLSSLASDQGASAILLDGPQGWKAPDNGLEHSRRCERELATQGKTGLPNRTKPASFRGFAQFSIDLFDELSRLGYPRLARSRAGPGKTSVEVYPTSAWRALGLSPLPSKRRATRADISERLRALTDMAGVRFDGDPSHDELQATVAGIAGSSLQWMGWPDLSLSGIEPFILEGSWREGYILNPRLPF